MIYEVIEVWKACLFLPVGLRLLSLEDAAWIKKTPRQHKTQISDRKQHDQRLCKQPVVWPGQLAVALEGGHHDIDRPGQVRSVSIWSEAKADLRELVVPVHTLIVSVEVVPVRCAQCTAKKTTSVSAGPRAALVSGWSLGQTHPISSKNSSPGAGSKKRGQADIIKGECGAAVFSVPTLPHEIALAPAQTGGHLAKRL